MKQEEEGNEKKEEAEKRQPTSPDRTRSPPLNKGRPSAQRKGRGGDAKSEGSEKRRRG